MFRFTFFFFSAVFAITLSSSAQEVKQKKNHGTFYFSWGYNKDWYTHSDIHFEDHITDDYDFTVHDVKAQDSPMLNHIFDTDISIPQFCYRFGYFFNDRHNLGIEVSFDHAKYITNDMQRVHVTGYIREEKLNKDTVIGESFVYLEHTNGANFLMFNLLKKETLHESKNKKHRFDAVMKAGGGIVIPKTDVWLMGENRDNVFHIAGYIVGIESAVRWKFLKSFFIEPAFKGVFANYTNVLTLGSAKANHNFFAAEAILTAGFQINFSGKQTE